MEEVKGLIWRRLEDYGGVHHMIMIINTTKLEAQDYLAAGLLAN